MRRAQGLQNEQYTILRSRLQSKSQPTCRTCHAPLRPSAAICLRCGANRTQPITGVTQQLPNLPAPVPWLRRYWRLMFGLSIALVQAGVWLWLWPLPQVAASRHGEPHVALFYYTVVLALGATLGLHCRWKMRAGSALAGLLLCWSIRVLMA